MKAVYFINNPCGLDRVFSARTRSAITAIAGEELSVFTPESLREAGGCEAVVLFSTWGMPVLDSGEISALFPRLRYIFYAAGSVRGFAAPYLERGVRVFSAWGANGVPVADYTAAQTVLASKGFFTRMRHGSALPINRDPLAGGCSSDTTVGIIGLGMIGKLVAQRLTALRFDVCGWDAFLPDSVFDELGVRRVSLEELFSCSDIITNHLANNPQTVGMLNRSLFERMKEEAVFINTGRGAQVVEDELCDALRRCPSRVALLDVTFPEPPAEGSPLYDLPNVFLAPHIAGSLGGECRLMGDYMLDEFSRITKGEAPLWEVSLEMLKTMA